MCAFAGSCELLHYIRSAFPDESPLGESGVIHPGTLTGLGEQTMYAIHTSDRMCEMGQTIFLPHCFGDPRPSNYMAQPIGVLVIDMEDVMMLASQATFGYGMYEKSTEVMRDVRLLMKNVYDSMRSSTSEISRQIEALRVATGGRISNERKSELRVEYFRKQMSLAFANRLWILARNHVERLITTFKPESVRLLWPRVGNGNSESDVEWMHEAFADAKCAQMVAFMETASMVLTEHDWEQDEMEAMDDYEDGGGTLCFENTCRYDERIVEDNSTTKLGEKKEFKVDEWNKGVAKNSDIKVVQDPASGASTVLTRFHAAFDSSDTKIGKNPEIESSASFSGSRVLKLNNDRFHLNMKHGDSHVGSEDSFVTFDMPWILEIDKPDALDLPEIGETSEQDEKMKGENYVIAPNLTKFNRPFQVGERWFLRLDYALMDHYLQFIRAPAYLRHVLSFPTEDEALENCEIFDSEEHAADYIMFDTEKKVVRWYQHAPTGLAHFVSDFKIYLGMEHVWMMWCRMEISQIVLRWVGAFTMQKSVLFDKKIFAEYQKYINNAKNANTNWRETRLCHVTEPHIYWVRQHSVSIRFFGMEIARDWVRTKLNHAPVMSRPTHPTYEIYGALSTETFKERRHWLYTLRPLVDFVRDSYIGKKTRWMTMMYRKFETWTNPSKIPRWMLLRNARAKLMKHLQVRQAVTRMWYNQKMEPEDIESTLKSLLTHVDLRTDAGRDLSYVRNEQAYDRGEIGIWLGSFLKEIGEEMKQNGFSWPSGSRSTLWDWTRHTTRDPEDSTDDIFESVGQTLTPHSRFIPDAARRCEAPMVLVYSRQNAVIESALVADANNANVAILAPSHAVSYQTWFKMDFKPTMVSSKEISQNFATNIEINHALPHQKGMREGKKGEANIILDAPRQASIRLQKSFMNTTKRAVPISALTGFVLIDIPALQNKIRARWNGMPARDYVTMLQWFGCGVVPRIPGFHLNNTHMVEFVLSCHPCVRKSGTAETKPDQNSSTSSSPLFASPVFENLEIDCLEGKEKRPAANPDPEKRLVEWFEALENRKDEFLFLRLFYEWALSSYVGESKDPNSCSSCFWDRFVESSSRDPVLDEMGEPEKVRETMLRYQQWFLKMQKQSVLRHNRLPTSQFWELSCDPHIVGAEDVFEADTEYFAAAKPVQAEDGQMNDRSETPLAVFDNLNLDGDSDDEILFSENKSNVGFNDVRSSIISEIDFEDGYDDDDDTNPAGTGLLNIDMRKRSNPSRLSPATAASPAVPRHRSMSPLLSSEKIARFRGSDTVLRSMSVVSSAPSSAFVPLSQMQSLSIPPSHLISYWRSIYAPVNPDWANQETDGNENDDEDIIWRPKHWELTNEEARENGVVYFDAEHASFRWMVGVLLYVRAMEFGTHIYQWRWFDASQGVCTQNCTTGLIPWYRGPELHNVCKSVMRGDISSKISLTDDLSVTLPIGGISNIISLFSPPGGHHLGANLRMVSTDEIFQLRTNPFDSVHNCGGNCLTRTFDISLSEVHNASARKPIYVFSHPTYSVENCKTETYHLFTPRQQAFRAETVLRFLRSVQYGFLNNRKWLVMCEDFDINFGITGKYRTLQEMWGLTETSRKVHSYNTGMRTPDAVEQLVFLNLGFEYKQMFLFFTFNRTGVFEDMEGKSSAAIVYSAPLVIHPEHSFSQQMARTFYPSEKRPHEFIHIPWSWKDITVAEFPLKEKNDFTIRHLEELFGSSLAEEEDYCTSEEENGSSDGNTSDEAMSDGSSSSSPAEVSSQTTAKRGRGRPPKKTKKTKFDPKAKLDPKIANEPRLREGSREFHRARLKTGRLREQNLGLRHTRKETAVNFESGADVRRYARSFGFIPRENMDMQRPLKNILATMMDSGSHKVVHPDFLDTSVDYLFPFFPSRVRYDSYGFLQFDRESLELLRPLHTQHETVEFSETGSAAGELETVSFASSQSSICSSQFSSVIGEHAEDIANQSDFESDIFENNPNTANEENWDYY